MRRLLLLSLAAMALVNACSKKEPGETVPENFILVQGGAFLNNQSNLYGKEGMVPDFYLGRFEVTQKEWTDVMGNNPSQFKGDDLPVEMVSWYDCVEYCNKRSMMEDLTPFYNIDKSKKDSVNKSEIDSIKWTVTINPGATGYRLPTEGEWEYAAGGGQASKSYVYSGSNNLDEVGWYWRNSGDTTLAGAWIWSMLENNHCRTRPVGEKKPNELGLYDMSGNVREWCEDWYEDFEVTKGFVRVQRGGGWMGAEYRCETSDRDNFEANGKGPDQGFRLCRNK